MRTGISQINPCVGDIENNYEKIIEVIRSARSSKLDLIIFPELALTGYPPEDLLLRPGFIAKVDDYIEHLYSVEHGLDIIIGYPHLGENKLFNRLGYIINKSVDTYYTVHPHSCEGARYITNENVGTYYDKQELPNYGVFDEKRYFSPGNETVTVTTNGITLGLSICEDLWKPEHTQSLKHAKADIILSINASPFYKQISEDRLSLLEKRSSESGLPIIYVNTVGGQDEVVFDGGSLLLNPRGEVVFQAPRFEEGLFIFNMEKNENDLRLTTTETPCELNSELEIIYRALCLGVRDYVIKNGFKGAVVGLSGGIDSALTLAIAVEAIGPENVEVVLMPSKYTSDMSNDDAVEMAKNLNVKHHIVPIEQPFEAFNHILQPIFADLPVDVTEENIQARCRGVILMAISNKTGKIVLTTGNKSEMAVGYATLYGDMAGGFAPLKDVSKQLVYQLSEWVNRDKEIIPRRIIERPPSAELRPDQKDGDSLPPYDILDDILERYIEQDQEPETIIATGHDKKIVYEVVRLVDRNEYKRRQAAPGVKITKRAFGRDRRYPITSGYKEY